MLVKILYLPHSTSEGKVIASFSLKLYYFLQNGNLERRTHHMVTVNIYLEVHITQYMFVQNH